MNSETLEAMRRKEKKARAVIRDGVRLFMVPMPEIFGRVASEGGTYFFALCELGTDEPKRRIDPRSYPGPANRASRDGNINVTAGIAHG